MFFPAATWMCLYIILTTTSSVVPVKTTYQLISGLEMERVPSPSSHFYKEYVPLVYQINIPRWNKSSTIVFGSQNCSSTNYTKFFTTCPVLFYLTDVHERFSDYLGNNQPLVVNLEDISAKAETALISVDCELIRPHFEDLFMYKGTVDEYLDKLKSCSPLGSQEFIQGLNNYVYNISSIYQEMRRNFYSEFWLKIDLVDGRVDAAIWANAINTINSLLVQNYMMEANRWKMATMDCEAGRIPSTILPPSLVGDMLTDMLESLSSKKLLPTVSTDSIGNYYKSALADCTFTSSDTFLVRILIPVIPENEKFLLVKLSPIPFYYRDPVTKADLRCEVDPEVLPKSSTQSEETYVLVDLVKNIAYESDCKPGQLCHIPTALHPRKASPCVTAAFNWERYKGNNGSIREDLIKYCPIKCSPANQFEKYFFKHLPPFEYLWFVGDSSGNTNLGINCSLNPLSSGSAQNLQFRSSYGSKKFEVSCDCQLKFRSQVYKPKPCNIQRENRALDHVQVSNLAPVQWYSADALKKNGIKEFWNVPLKFFENPSTQLIRQSIRRGDGTITSAKISSQDDTSSSNKGTTIFIVFLTIVSVALITLVVALAWRLHSLIEQLEGMGLNVRGAYNVGGSQGNGSGGQQVTYRNMGSLVDTDSLLINEG